MNEQNTPKTYYCEFANGHAEPDKKPEKFISTQIPVLTPSGAIHWLMKCASDVEGQCKDCPYNHGETTDGCAMLLRDAALLLTAAYGKDDNK